ncbi:MAG: nucleotide sugar dehydrogenase [Geodermatophilaceae bacterium]|nr:nucleotide sugar dehydrogenase [Geodermatophilaceae bacterium]
MTRLVVVGQGYVGLPLAMRAVQAGHDVTGLDTSIDRVKRLSAGDSFVEDVPDTELLAALASGRYRVTDSPSACDGFDVAVVAVPTPLRDSAPDLGYVEQAARTLAPFVTRDCLVVLESTTYPGTTEAVVVPLLEAGSGLTAGWDFAVGYSPERIDPGNAEWTLTTTPKIVSGIDPASLARTEKFYGALVERTVPVSSTRSAELAKLLENTFRHVNIALVNELAMVAADLGVDVWEAIDAASTKPFGFMRFTPGPGVGGHCLPIDPSYLSWTVRQRLGRSFRFVELANDINDHMPDYVLSRLMHGLNRQGRAMSRSRVLVLGLAYKRNSGDAREAPAAALIDLLVREGAEVAVVDPHVVEELPLPATVRRVALSQAELAAADAVVLVTDHEAFDYELVAEHAGYVLDTRNRMRGPRVEQL